ncbi:uncharacterized protein [Amphiura filiformis]|uniref:uncharacterized protein n=1 Tax=Amphiura filiformis TaxID=82378 RepID=UPI003B20EC9C
MQEGDREIFPCITKPDTIVMYADPEDSMQAATQDTQEWIREVMMHLKRRGLRPIPVSELGLAVLYASTQLHCNPKVAQAGLNLLNAPPTQTTTRPQVLVSDTQASCSKNAADDRGQRSSVQQPKVSRSSSSEDERKGGQGSKKRMRQDSAPQMTSKMPKLEPPSPAAGPARQSSKTEVAETPQKSSESLQSGPNIKTSPEFSFVGTTVSKQPHLVKEEIVSPPAERNNNKQGKVKVGQRLEVGQRSEAVDEEEHMDMGSDHEEAGSVKEEDVSVVHEEENVRNGNQKKTRMATLDSLWDGEGNTRPRRRMKEDVRIEEEEVKTDAVAEEEDSQNSMWKKKRKRNVLDQIEAEEARESQLSQDHEESESNAPSHDTPAGFFTATKPTKEEHKTEPKEEPGAPKAPPPPYAVVSIEDSSLVIRRPKPRPANNTPVIGRTNIKNFKKFRKAGYASQTGMPHIIGGRDLEEHSNRPNDDIDDMMFGGLQAEQRRNRDEEQADRLFADEPRGRKGRGR